MNHLIAGYSQIVHIIYFYIFFLNSALSTDLLGKNISKITRHCIDSFYSSSEDKYDKQKKEEKKEKKKEKLDHSIVDPQNILIFMVKAQMEVL